MYKFLYLFLKSNKICLIQQIKKNIVKINNSRIKMGICNFFLLQFKNKFKKDLLKCIFKTHFQKMHFKMHFFLNAC
jgi:hypothetical protein